MLMFMHQKWRRRRMRVLLPIAAVGCALGVLMSNGCARTIANRDPTGEVFPRVNGQSLEKEKVELPAAVAGNPAILLIGYRQRTQFDIDRWFMGLLQSGVDAQLIEVPTVPGLAATVASGWIDDGMRSGIPREDWGAVVTVYGKAAEPIVELTGNENGRLARVLVLDEDGRVVWFDDKGYSARKALEVADLVSSMKTGSP
jgi:hypothetical protein